MKDIMLFISGIMQIFNVEITLYGYTFTFWNIFCVGWLLSIAGYVIYKILDR